MFASVDVRDVLPAIHVPTLVLQRRGDRVTNPGVSAYLAENIAGATNVELDGIDHLPFVGDAEQVVAEIEQFLTGSRPAPPVADRVLATVLFADVVGFTSLSEGTDPEVVARTVDAAFRRMAEVVVEHGGTVDKYLGDCLMAVFGVPQAHDDDAERAVAAGLRLGVLGSDLAFSIGINSGEVMVTVKSPSSATPSTWPPGSKKPPGRARSSSAH
jgi:hypothetical protein